MQQPVQASWHLQLIWRFCKRSWLGYAQIRYSVSACSKRRVLPRPFAELGSKSTETKIQTTRHPFPSSFAPRTKLEASRGNEAGRESRLILVSRPVLFIT